jgi:hypothetical protein
MNRLTERIIVFITLAVASGVVIAGVAMGHGTGTDEASACYSAQRDAQLTAVAQGAKNIKKVGECSCSSSAGGTIWSCETQAEYD